MVDEGGLPIERGWDSYHGVRVCRVRISKGAPGRGELLQGRKWRRYRGNKKAGPRLTLPWLLPERMAG